MHLEAQHAPRSTARHLVITKALFSAAVALSVAVGVAIPVSADPSAFGVLSCSCGDRHTATVGGPTVSDQVNAGKIAGRSFRCASYATRMTTTALRCA